MIAPMLVTRGHPIVFEFVPELFGDLIPDAIFQLQLAELPGFRRVVEMFVTDHLSIGGVTATLLLALPLFILGSLGVRSIGIPLMMVALCSWKTAPPIRVCLSLFVILGCLATILIRVTPIDFPRAYDNSVWFFAQSKLIAWVFVGEALRRMFQSGFRYAGVIGTSILVILSAPGAVNFFAEISDDETIRISRKDTAEVVEYLAQEAHPGAVVLSEDEGVSIDLLASTSIRVPFQNIFAISFLPKKDILEYGQELRRFWVEWGVGGFRAETAAKYDVDYIVALSPRTGATAAFSNDTYHVYPTRSLILGAQSPRKDLD